MLFRLVFLILALAIVHEGWASNMQTKQDNPVHVVVAMPFKPGIPFEPHWYSPEYVDYIASFLPKDRYVVSGYFVSLQNIPQFLDDMEKLNAEKGPIVVLNICDGGEWDGYPGLSVCLAWEKHRINGVIPKSGADYAFILNSDDKIKMQTFLAQAHLNALPQMLITSQQSLDPSHIATLLSSAGLDSSWPLFCKLNVGAGALSINDESVCPTPNHLLTHLQKLRVAYPASDIIVQPYLPGHEYTVLVVGDRVFAAVRRDFHNPLNLNYEDYITGVRNLQEELTYYPCPAHVQKLALDALRAIPGRQHYARVDLRDDAHGKTYVIDINERPGIGTPSTVSTMLEYLHLSEAQLWQEIIATCRP